MNCKKARDLINKHRLVEGQKSRSLLDYILEDKDFATDFLPEGIEADQLESLRSSYKKRLAELKKSGFDTERPRYIVFYHLLKDKYPSFIWTYKSAAEYKINIQGPRIENLRPSLLSLFMNDVDIDMDTDLHRRYLCMKDLPTDINNDFSWLFQSIHALYPNHQNMQTIVSWLQKGLQGTPLTLFSAVCPDYSVEETGDKQCPYRHTFDSLGSEIGMVAKRILDALPSMYNFFEKYDIKVTSIVAMGDFEVYAESNLKRLNISSAEFLSRLNKSHAKTREASTIPIQAIMFTELCGGYEGWISYFNKYQKMFGHDHYGHSNLEQNELLEIIKARKPLYDKWLGKRSSLEEYLPQLLDQGAEYASMGEIINQNYDNCLILGADHSVMAPFYSIDQFIPSLYLKRFYC